MNLRHYQRDAGNAIYKSWREGINSVAVQMCTGSGKTVLFSHIGRHEAEQGNRTCVIIDREELLTQFKDKLEQATGLKCGVERASEQAGNESIIVASIQSLSRDKRLNRYHPDHFDLFIIDEAHKSMADTYLKVFEHFNARIAGFSATFFRNDKRSLGDVYQDVVYEYSMRQAINDGWLVPVKAQTVPIEIDLSNVRTKMGDYNDADCASAIEPYLNMVAEEMKRLAPDRTHIVFLPLCDTSRKMAQACNDVGFRAVHVDGKSKDREQILKDFEDGRYNVLCNAQLLSYGYDNHQIDSVVWLRPTQSNLIYIQGVGRGTRPNPPGILNDIPSPQERRVHIQGSAKPDLLVLDFLWSSARHRLCHPAVLFAETEEIADKAKERMRGSNQLEDLEDLVADAELEIQNERERSLAKYIDANKGKKKQKLDPIHQMVCLISDELIDYQASFAWEKKEASQQQIELLSRKGFKNADTFNAGYASAIIDTLNKRQKRGLCTLKQANVLMKRGYNASKMTFDEANRLIGELANNGWKKPYRRRA